MTQRTDSDATPGRGPKLHDVGAIKRELGRVYRLVDRQAMDPSEGTKRAHMLQALAKLIETSDLEARLEALERQLHRPRAVA